jgi:hypothetical protein
VAKKYSMTMGLDTAAFEAACRRAEKGLSAVEKAGKAAAAATTLGGPGGGGGGSGGGAAAAGSAAVTAKASTAAQLAKIEDRYLAQEYRGRVRHQARLLKEEEKAAGAAQRLLERGAAEKQRIEDKWFLRDYRSRGELERRRAALAEAAAARQAQAFGKVSSSVTGLPVSVTAVGAALLGLEVGTRIVSTLAGAFARAQQAAEDMARKTLDTTGSLREIAAIKEKFAPTDEELAQHLAVRKAGGLTHGVAVAYQTELYNALGTISKEKFPDSEREKLEIEGAKLIGRTVKRGDESTAKAKSTVLGLLPDYLPGKPTAGQVADVGDAVDVILGKGAGSQQVSTTQYQHVLTATTSEKMPGQFREPRMAAAFTATASKFGPDSAGEATMEAFRQLRGFTKELKSKGAKSSQGQTLKKMGITEFDAPDVAMMKMFAFADKEFKGEAFDVALARRGFKDLTGNKRLGQFYEQYQKGNLQEMIALAKAPIPEGTADRKFRANMKAQATRDEMVQNDVEIAEIERGKQTRELLIGKNAAKAEMIKEGLEDTGVGDLKKVAASFSTGFFKPGKEVIAEERALEAAKQRAGFRPEGLAGVNDNPLFRIMAGFGTLGLSELSMRRGVPAMTGQRAEEMETLKRIADNQEKLKELQEQQARRNSVPAALPGGPAARGGPVQ